MKKKKRGGGGEQEREFVTARDTLQEALKDTQ